jgi:hypothetical protein
MTPRRFTLRHTAAVLAALGCVFGVPAFVAADDDDAGGTNHVVHVQNSVDNTVRTRGGVTVDSTDADRVTATNLAIAESHDCTGCQSLAAAYQAVFVTGNPSEESPQNAAIATNTNCTGCGSFAFAYQYVLKTGERVRLSHAGRAEVRTIRNEARRELEAGSPYPELDARLHELALRFRGVIDAEVQRAGADVDDRRSIERQDAD